MAKSTAASVGHRSASPVRGRFRPGGGPLVPGGLRPHVLQNPKVEHLAAYVVVGAQLAIGVSNRMHVLSAGLPARNDARINDQSAGCAAGRLGSLAENRFDERQARTHP
jgi:hypothetical protein